MIGFADLVRGTLIKAAEIQARFDALSSGASLPAGFLPPTGMISMYGGSSAPSGWVICDGASVLRSAFPNLFSAIGTTYGSVDGTHFNLPDLRGRGPVGPDGGAGRLTANNSLGQASGAENHFHWQTVGMDATNFFGEVDGAGSGHTRVITQDRSVVTSGSRGTTGTRGDGTYDSSSMAPYAVVNFIIKT